ncbi:MAG: hypothetical protein KDC84_01070 [Crocinitomicaceae bacterium]|nr:hypothetical protein [Crocinitomicaceae bacterium]
MKKILFFLPILLVLYNCSTGEQKEKKSEENTSKKETGQEETPHLDTLFKGIGNLQDVEFTVVAIDQGETAAITITPSGLENSNEAVLAISESKNISFAIEDLDSDGSPELIVFAKVDDLNTDIFAYSTYNKKSMGLINFQENSPEIKTEKAHLIKKEYAVVETTLSRRNTYEKEDGSTYVVQTDYKLVDGEAMKQLIKSKEYQY